MRALVSLKALVTSDMSLLGSVSARFTCPTASCLDCIMLFIEAPKAAGEAF